MMRLSKKLTGLCLSLIMVSMLLVSFPFTANKANAFTTANADTAMSAFVSTFYDSSAKYFYTNSDHAIHAEHAHGPNAGLYTDFWWEAQLWETVMDAYQRTGSATYRTMIDDIYTGFNLKYTNMTDNQFNDDLGWWALACLRAYEITGTVEYLNRGSFLFDTVYASWSTTNYGGGIWWRRDATNPASSTNAQKNMATNAPMIMAAIKLKNAYSNSAYLTKAQQIYTWTKSTLVNGSKVNDHIEGTGTGLVKDWDFTYNYGTFLGAALALYQDTSTASYLTDANSAANYVIDKMTSATSLLYEGENDAPGFKMIFARNLNQLRVQASQSQYLSFLQSNATQAWNHRRTTDNIIGNDWLKPTGTTYVQSLAAAAGVSILQFVPADAYTGNIAGNGVYEAENARRTLVSSLGMVNESTNTGYNGRGYVAGWNTNATSIDFYVNQNSASTKTVTFRYSAAAGNASRYVKVNGVFVANNLSFTGTANWTTWNTVTVSVPLNAGSNTIQLGFDSSKSNSNYLNVDRLSGL
ncbi:carbohydrate-binding protein [Paenibacillus psychroresistens]|uniref:Carbohydrate-binding protein n=1 Tax=Paenibacillus psychroresistens TaxID=1778678 RepID=A0A6B8RJ57_9BACL|nr:glycoside hydrolase family 76 protein [Paenibacillus psychroresistens]QGQ95622.1 carbohydrate-binding protein [Paenibacillus psychroresistens]